MAYPNSVDANCAQIAKQISATLAAIVQEIKQQARHTPTKHSNNQWQNHAQPKQSQKLLNCGYLEDEDCLCEVIDSRQSVYQDENDEDVVDLDFKEDESHQGKLQNRQEDDRVIPEVRDANELLAKMEDPNSLVNQVCVQSAHGKFGTNEKEFPVADKVFDKSPKRNGYVACLNPKPPDVYDSLDGLINYGQSVAKQMHDVVVLYNYFSRKRYSKLEFLGLESVCKLVVNQRPSISAHMKFMHQSICTVSDDRENQLSLTEMTIMDACKLCLALAVSKDVPSTEEWPISKVAILLIDSSKKNYALVFSSVTHGVWSVLEKGFDIHYIISGSTLVGNNKKDLGDLVARYIMALKVTYPDDATGTLDVVLARQFCFFREINPQPRKHTLWQAEISLESSYFELRIYVLNESDESNNEYEMNSDGGSTIFVLRNATSPSGAQSSPSKNEHHNFVGRHPDHFQETPSPSSVLGSSVSEEIKSSGIGKLKNLNYWDQMDYLINTVTIGKFIMPGGI